MPARDCERSLSSNFGRNSDVVLVADLCARFWNHFVIINPSGNRFSKRILGLNERLGFVTTGCMALGQITKRDDDLVLAYTLQEWRDR